MIQSSRPLHLGSWLILCDIAGQVSSSPENPIVTIGAVALPAGHAREARRRLIQRFADTPLKWKKGRLDGLKHVSDLMAIYSARAAVLQLHREAGVWARFYEQASTFRAEALKAFPAKQLSYLDGDEVMRMRLFGEGFSQLVGRILRERHPWGDRQASLELELVVDSDLKAAESREQFAEAVEEWAATSALHRRLGVTPTITSRVQTEQEEPLLLLADYIAGVYQHADPRAKLDHPVVPALEASLAVEGLRLRLNTWLYEMPDDFDTEYPLEHRDGEVARRRARSP